MNVINFTDGNEVGIIFRKKKDESDEEYKKITSIKINSKGSNIPEFIISKKDKNLRIDNNIFNKPKVDDYDYKLLLSPEHDPEQNNRIVIIAPSGSGKSTFASNYINLYKKKYRKNNVFLFSRHDVDPSIDKSKPTRVQVTEDDIIESSRNREPVLENDNLADSLVIFDDIDKGSSKLLTNYWYTLASDLSQNARKLSIDLMFILHNTNYSKTRMLMSEATHYCYFLNSGSKAMYIRLLKSYQGIDDKKIINKLFNIKSRYIVFSNIAPLYILTENMVMLMNDF